MPKPDFSDCNESLTAGWDNLRDSLASLYASSVVLRSVWRDPADHAFITRHLIERSIALNTGFLRGDLIDVGCGLMPYGPYYNNCLSITACDADKQRGQIDLVCPAHRIPVPAGAFNTVVCTEVLEHVPEPQAVWDEFARILAPNGTVLLATPSYWPAHEIPRDYYRYTEHGLRYLARHSGFEVERIIPRGGMWAFYGQVSVHVVGHYMKLSSMRRLWNAFFLWADRTRLNPAITLGWTIIARKVR